MKNLLAECDLAPLLQGVVRHETEGDRVRLHRFTQRQIDAFSEREGWLIRCRCHAGSAIAMRTDTQRLHLKAQVYAGARQYLGIDVEVDGMVLGGLRRETQTEQLDDLLLDLTHLPRRPRQVRIWLPHSLPLGLTELLVDDDASVEPLPPAGCRLLTLGDSITQGMNAVSTFCTYPVQLARLLNAELLNQGVGGHVFAPHTLDPDLAFAPDIVTIAYGTNDWSSGITPAVLAEKVLGYLQRLRTIWPAAHLVLMSPIYRVAGEEQRACGTLRDVSRIIGQAAADVKGVTFIDGFSLLPHQPWYMPDGTHPNEAGFLHYALNIYRAIRG